MPTLTHPPTHLPSSLLLFCRAAPPHGFCIDGQRGGGGKVHVYLTPPTHNMSCG
ncbi:hypothetical protein COCMIDRAFT_81017 [Bipolaris oryzae ATCC 44560]|uniref:Uncharacterized protein n=1 Tax=Bipolaris oryzae ATCC 44560 TaxID=930090 RepID=W6ZL61_COCMI|nr:uncharacterized protein COCMIDRAFT_81017 [Bipolaris oryzae ATCC 44560]EUC50805.1 hypothetical protein COCMIDRAFT_81017 [Bipolaris oryzae ATCC 44560]